MRFDHANIITLLALTTMVFLLVHQSFGAMEHQLMLNRSMVQELLISTFK